MDKNRCAQKSGSEKICGIDRNDAAKFMFREIFGSDFEYLEKALKPKTGTEEAQKNIQWAGLIKDWTDDVIKFCFREMFGNISFGYLEKAMKAKAEPKEIQKNVQYACLRKAWPDAMLRAKNKHSGNIDESKTDDIIKDCNPVFEKVLDEYSNEEKFDFLWELYSSEDAEIRNIKNKICEIKKEFTFGRFQKLFNMAVKYYACVCEFKDRLGLGELKIFSLCHANCPVDSIIAKKIKKKKNSIDLPIKYKNFLKKEITWSTMDYDDHEDYILIQEIIQLFVPELPNLAFDFKEWQ